MDKMHIPNWLDETFTAAFEHITETIESEYEVEGNVTEIAYKSYDGFIPFTNGGISFTTPIDLAYLVGTGKGFTNEDVTKSINKTVDYCYTNAREAFIAEHREELEDWFSGEELDANADTIEYNTLQELKLGSLAEGLSETEYEWLTDYLFIEIRVMYFAEDNSRNKSGKDEIYFLAGVNLDYGYGRDKGIEETFELNMKVEDLTPAIVNEIIKNMLDSI